jgi:type I restriction enzyme S subunit
MKVPKNWVIHPVGHLFEVQLGKMLNEKAKMGDSHLPYLTNFNVQWSRFNLGVLNTMYFTERERKKFELKQGDLIVCEGGEVGRCAIWKEQIKPCYYQKALHRLRPKDSSILPEFMLAYMKFAAGTRRLSDLTSQSSIAHLTREKLVTLDVMTPPVIEQRKIAAILTTWDDALETLDALITAKDRRKRALMQQLLTGRQRFPAFGKRAWTKVRMSQVLERVFRPIEWSADMPLSLISIRRRCGGLFRRPDLLGSEYKTQDLHDLRAGDFLVSKRQVAHGAWAMVTPEFAGGHVSKEYAIFVNSAPAKLHMPFFAWLARTPRMIRLSRVASTGVHIEKLIFDPDVFLRESIRIPADLAEQRQIAAILDTADQELTLLRAQRNALDQQKRGLMQRLLTGKIRVRTY